MSIGGEFLLERIDADAWKRFAGAVRIDDAWLIDTVARMADAAPDAFEAALADIDDWDGSASEVRRRVLPAVREHTRGVTEGISRGRRGQGSGRAVPRG